MGAKREAKLQDANLYWAELQDANLQDANLQGTDLSTAKDLAQALNLDTTIGNAKTKLPKGFPWPKSWDK